MKCLNTSFLIEKKFGLPVRFMALVFLIVLSGLSYSLVAAAAYNSFKQDAHCPPGFRPTGCMEPYETCIRADIDVTKHSGIASCKNIASQELCPDFTWEKCCVVTCRQAFKQLSAAIQAKEKNPDQCIAKCMSAPESNMYTPNLYPPSLKRSEQRR